ncbi:MAG: hypothetical protein J6Z23_02330 [Lachnospiraceae bacterium]|nr:hypothetical protein [Lachnospiraceae bacterium]MBP5254204.1 hypothetical protein [Lachnospiraceae bacterium]
MKGRIFAIVLAVLILGVFAFMIVRISMGDLNGFLIGGGVLVLFLVVGYVLKKYVRKPGDGEQETSEKQS